VSISDAQFTAWLARDTGRTVICEMGFAYESGGAPAEGLICLSDTGFTSRGSDSPPHRIYHKAMAGAPVFRREIDRETLGGAARIEVSDLRIVNVDGQFDYLLKTVLDGYPARFYLGSRDWARADFRLAFAAFVERVVAPSDSEIVIELRDARLLLDREVIGDQVGGAGAEATQYLPIVFGPQINVEARKYDGAAESYSVVSNYAAGAVASDVRDKGVSLLSSSVTVCSAGVPLITVDAGTEVFSLTGHGMAVNDVVKFEETADGSNYTLFAPFAGMVSGQQYWVRSVPTANSFTLSETKGGSSINVTGTTYLGQTGLGSISARMRRKRYYDDLANTGRIELSASPSGRVTVDLLNVGTYTAAPFALMAYLIETYGNVDAADIDSSAFTAADTALDAKLSNARNYSLFIRERANLIEVLDEICASCFGWYGQARDGRITCGLVDVSGIATAAAVTNISENDIVGDAGLAVENEFVAPGRMTVEYDPNRTVQSDGLADAADHRTYALQHLTTQRSASASGTAYATNKQAYHRTMVEAAPRPISISHYTFNSLGTLVAVGDFAEEMVADAAPTRQFITAPVGLEFYATELGYVALITYPRYSMDAGVNARVIAIETDLTGGRVTLDLVRRFDPDVSTASHP
jgi:hypothetical protein